MFCDLTAPTLLTRARAARSPYTRTEQDVLESLLPPSVGRGADNELVSEGISSEFGRRQRRRRRLRARSTRRLQELADQGPDGASAFTTPDVVMPAHMHYYYHGCENRAASRDVVHRLPRQQCATGTGEQRVAGRVIVEGGGADTAPASASVGAGASASSLARPSPGGMERVAIEWLEPTPLRRRNVSRVRVDQLCGGAVELVERCDALLWRARRAVGRRLQRRGTHALAQSLAHVPQLERGGEASDEDVSGGGGGSNSSTRARRSSSSSAAGNERDGRRLAGKKKAAKAARSAAGEVNASTLIRDLFRAEYDGPGAQQSGCILADDPAIASNRRFL